MDANQFYNKYIADWKHTDVVRIGDTFCKLEHQNPTGSVKDRGISYQIYELLRAGISKAVITSSGNAAISAAYYSSIGDIELDVFVSQHMSEEKYIRLISHTKRIHQVVDPVSEAKAFAEKTGAYNLQQSLNINAPTGFKNIVYELKDQLCTNEISMSDVAFMMPVSSGTTAIGVIQALVELEETPQLHVAQNTAVQTIVHDVAFNSYQRSKSIVTGLVARSTQWKNQIQEYVTSSGGAGWVVDDERVNDAVDTLKSHGIAASLEGSLAFAADSFARSLYPDYPLCSIVLLT